MCGPIYWSFRQTDVVEKDLVDLKSEEIRRSKTRMDGGMKNHRKKRR